MRGSGPMKHRIFARKNLTTLCAAILVFPLGLAAGCKLQTARTDQQIASDIQAKIHGEQALAGQNIQVSVANSVATLSGNVTDEASRTLAAYDSGSVNGVKTVVNNLTVQPAQSGQALQTVPALKAMSGPPAAVPATARKPTAPKQPAKIVKPAPSQTHPQQAQLASPLLPQTSLQPAATQVPAPASAAPTQPPGPVVKQVTLPAGTYISIRTTEELSSKTAQPNDVFHGAVAGDIGTAGVIAIPHGTPVIGRVVDAKDAVHFKGSAFLSLELTQATVRGERLTLATDSYSREGEGRGKNTVEKSAGGAALGAIIGAIAGGGKGAAIGGLAGGAAGTGVNAATRGQQVVIPPETLIDFQLQSPITFEVTISPPGSAPDEVSDPQLEHR